MSKEPKEKQTTPEREHAEWLAWLDSARGVSASDPNTQLDRAMLENRLYRAYRAGVEAGYKSAKLEIKDALSRFYPSLRDEL